MRKKSDPIFWLCNPYISVSCQKTDWKEHKRSACVKPAVFHKLDRMMKKMNSTMGLINHLEKTAWEERRRNPTPVSKVWWMFCRFKGAPIEEKEEDDDDDDEDKDFGDVFKRCSDCDYTICEGCSKLENQGELFLDNSFG